MLYLAETEYIETKDDNKIKRQKNIDRHYTRPIPKVCHHPDPPRFSLVLQTTFKLYLFHHNICHSLHQAINHPLDHFILFASTAILNLITFHPILIIFSFFSLYYPQK